MSLYRELSTLVAEKLEERFHPYEVRVTLQKVAARWKTVLSPQERKKISRTLGGNRYAKVTYELLDTLFEEVLDDSRS